MKLFFERNEYKIDCNSIQKERINTALQNRLWSIIHESIFSKIDHGNELPYTQNSNISKFIKACWLNVFQNPTDTIPQKTSDSIQAIRKYFFECEWYKTYSLIEEAILHYPYSQQFFKQQFVLEINTALERENSAYKIINNKVTEITSAQEIQSIENALVNTNPYSGVQQHLKQALQLMSDRQNPDYRNSIKESISAVEALAMQLLGDNSITLGKAIPKIRMKYDLPSTLMESLNKLYGYASNENGVRHGSPEESSISYSDAKFMFVACTNFINYLIEKTK